MLKSVLPEVPTGAIFRGVGRFTVADLVRLALVVFVPGVVLFLPSLMR